MRRVFAVVVMLTALGLATFGVAASDVRFEPIGPELIQHRDVTEPAVQHLLDLCPAIQRNWRSVSVADATFWPTAPEWRARQRGWRSMLGVRIELAENPMTWTPEFLLWRIELQDPGRVLTYHIGGADNPGMIAMSRLAARACGIEHPIEDETFIADPAFAVLGAH